MQEFFYTQAVLQQKARDILDLAQQLGASAAQVEISEDINTDITVRQQEIETFESSHSCQLGITVFCQQHKGVVAASGIDLDVRSLVLQALDIAKYTQADPANGLLAPQFIARTMHQDLALYHACVQPKEVLISTLKQTEAIALADANIKSSEGSALSMQNSHFVLANSYDFNQGYAMSRYSNSLSLIATQYQLPSAQDSNTDSMQTDYWYSSARQYSNLLSAADLAAQAIARVKRKTQPTTYYPIQNVIFESPIAQMFIAAIINGLSGSLLYRKLSFLNDSLGKLIFPTWLNITDDPFVVAGLASGHFDSEAGIVRKQHLIQDGRVATYLLSAYTARKMSMQPTGHAGGTHQLTITSNHHGDISTLAQTMGTGIIIIETIGSGINNVTGDYSIGASGLMVHDGIISGFVDNLTIAGNLLTLAQNIVFIADDSTPGTFTCGSILTAAGVVQVAAG